MTTNGKQLLTTLEADGTLTVELIDQTFADPTGTQVLVKVEATPINPSDLGLLFASADTGNAQYSPSKVTGVQTCALPICIGRWPESRIAEALAARDRTALGLNAPPHGLYFTGARYPD